MTRRSMFWRMVVSSILRRRSRVLIAILAVAIGATTLSGLTALAIDVPSQIAREVRSYGANLVVSPDAGADRLTDPVLERVSDLIPADALVGSASFAYETVLINDQPFVAAGGDFDAVKTVNPYWYVDGQWPSSAGQILIGEEIATTIGASPGHRITVALLGEGAQSGGEESQGSTSERPHSAELTIAGVLKTGGNEDSYLYMGFDDLAELTDGGAAVSIAEYSIALHGEELAGLAQRISDEVDGAVAQTVKRLADSDTGVIRMLRSLLAMITLIVLALTMIGVSTTMVAVVAERRNEIGLRKALGATSTSIVWEFIGEGALLGAFGGIGGAALGYGLAAAVSINVFHRAAQPHPLVIALTIIASIVVAVIACLPPVRRAAAIDPALVLRGE